MCSSDLTWFSSGLWPFATLGWPKSKVIKKDLPVDDPMRRKPDISMAKDLIDWEPTTDLKDGLKQTIDYFKSKLK